MRQLCSIAKFSFATILYRGFLGYILRLLQVHLLEGMCNKFNLNINFIRTHAPGNLQRQSTPIDCWQCSRHRTSLFAWAKTDLRPQIILKILDFIGMSGREKGWVRLQLYDHLTSNNCDDRSAPLNDQKSYDFIPTMEICLQLWNLLKSFGVLPAKGNFSEVEIDNSFGWIWK